MERTFAPFVQLYLFRMVLRQRTVWKDPKGQKHQTTTELFPPARSDQVSGMAVQEKGTRRGKKSGKNLLKILTILDIRVRALKSENCQHRRRWQLMEKNKN
ncbi:hypothetical protein COOONC_10913 [Cooperia oncophora]